jgi:hypothetical protein
MKRTHVNEEDRQPIREGSEKHEAPCVRGMLLGAFPGDEQRQNVVRVWSAARVSLDYVRARLEALNAQYPHSSGPMPLKKRWDYEAHYKKGYAPPKCDKLCDYCPFSGTTDQRKAKCFKLLLETFPDTDPIPKQWKFKGPAYWYEW